MSFQVNFDRFVRREHRAAAQEARDLNPPVMIDIIAGPNIVSIRYRQP
jgi:hypothetical protein